MERCIYDSLREFYVPLTENKIFRGRLLNNINVVLYTGVTYMPFPLPFKGREEEVNYTCILCGEALLWYITAFKSQPSREKSVHLTLGL